MKILIISIISLIITLTAISTIAENVNLTIPMSLEPEWFNIDPIQSPDTNGIWNITFRLSVPRGHVYTNISARVSTDRMQMTIGPVSLSTEQMQTILGDLYLAVSTSVDIGSFTPTGVLKDELVMAVAGNLE